MLCMPRESDQTQMKRELVNKKIDLMTLWTMQYGETDEPENMREM